MFPGPNYDMAEFKKVKDMAPEERLSWRRKMLKRKNERKRLRNLAVKTRISSLKRSFRKKCSAGVSTDAAEALKTLTSALDKAAKRGILHKSTANRRKSRLAKQLAKLAS